MQMSKDLNIIQENRKIIDYFKALSDQVRLQIVNYLLNRDFCNCICHIVKETGKDQSVIYRHLIILEKVGIINTRKEGKFLYSCIKDKNKTKEILNLVNEVLK